MKKVYSIIFLSRLSNNLVAVGQTTHTAHYAQHVVVGGVHTYLSGAGTRDGRVRQNQLESGVIDAAEIARARRLVLLRAQGERVDIDTGVRGTGVVLVGLHQVEVGSLTLREAVLTVKLKLGHDHRVLTPAVHVESHLRKHEGAGIRHGRVLIRVQVGSRAVNPGVTSGVDVGSTGISEQTIRVDEGVRTTSDGKRTTEGVDGVRQGINGVGVVERLGTQSLVQVATALKGGTVVDVGVRLDNPDELLARMVEVQLNLVGGRTYRLVTSELKLLNQVLVGVLGHTTALISIQENVVDVQRRGHEGLVVSSGHLLVTASAVQGVHGPQALINRAQIKVNLHLMVLEGNQGQSQTGVTAEPELERHVQSGLGQSVTRGAHLAGSAGVTGTVHVGERGISDVGQLSSVTDHLVVTLLVAAQSQLVPDMHPVTVLTVDALATNLDLNLRDELLTGEIQPAGVHGTVGTSHSLVDLGESHLQVGTVGQITIAADSASHTATEIGLTVERLLNRLHSEVSMATVGHLPEGNLRVTSKVHVLSAVGYKLHKSTTHGYTIAKEKKTQNYNFQRF